MIDKVVKVLLLLPYGVGWLLGASYKALLLAWSAMCIGFYDGRRQEE